MEIKNVIYVCEQNFDRSPTAADITRVLAAERRLDLQVSSAGLSNPIYTSRSLGMVRALEKLGYGNPNPHTPTQVDLDLLLNQDLILCFKDYQVQRINRLLHGQNKPVYTLPGFAGDHGTEISNPQVRTKNNLLSATVRHIPIVFGRNIISGRLGYVHGADVEGLEAVHDDIARQIEKYVVKALDIIALELKT